MKGRFNISYPELVIENSTEVNQIFPNVFIGTEVMHSIFEFLITLISVVSQNLTEIFIEVQKKRGGGYQQLLIKVHSTYVFLAHLA